MIHNEVQTLWFQITLNEAKADMLCDTKDTHVNELYQNMGLEGYRIRKKKKSGTDKMMFPDG